MFINVGRIKRFETAQYFDFGKEPQGGGQATPTAPSNYTSGTFG
jgi:hypothetical protein